MKFFIFAVTLAFLTGCGSKALHTLDGTLLLQGVEPAQLNAEPYQLTEGPTWDGGNFVYFTEIYKSRIHRYNIVHGTFELVRENTQNANGLRFSPDGLLWVCEQSAGRIVRLNNETGKVVTVSGEYEGKPFNHPNDLVLDKSGGVYFSDPVWNETLHRKQPVNGVYYVNADGDARLLINDMDKPNGVLLSQNGRFLYVVDMGTDEFRRYRVVGPGQLADKKSFARFNLDDIDSAMPDGMAEDVDGNVYVATNNGVQVFDREGRYLGRFALDQRPTNLAFFGKALNQLFITSMNNVYSVRLNTVGVSPFSSR
ncbi:SMP-30/gluconolactonase/LRE family protein [Teredinibacter haidensis]|uniref:SMP-30/gluconolactonase/LRE family protein n=1 Tax=Teredinibacter haidensis TaxID=2731755 RepID=UPI0009FA64D1|nr:SMP-30/gluconolactonase/LRE family protein [Teredinibacter haidensis]